MPSENLLPNRIIVIVSAVAYWAGVLVQARRVRRRIGRSPNVRPRGTKEMLLWAGWTSVVVAWLGLPLLVRPQATSSFLRLWGSVPDFISLWFGILLVTAGYAGTLWCYAAMGDFWRMGVNRSEQTVLVERGPFRYVRHPIYILQTVMLAGAAVLLPASAWLCVIGIHFCCMLTKALDEENHLRSAHGKNYEDYVSRTGRFLPKLKPNQKP